MNNKIDDALVMAAGRGLRMRPLTDDIPKAMAPFGESTLIAAGINRLQKEISNVHITVGYKGSILASHVIENDVSSVINTEGKGNGWWLYNSLLSLANKPIFVLTCDNVIKINFTSFATEYFKLGSPACMIIPAKPINEVEGDYIFKNNNDEILDFSRKKKSEFISSGIQILNPKKINQITKPCDSFNDIWDQLIHLKQIKCSRKVLDNWYSVDDLIQLEIARKKDI